MIIFFILNYNNFIKIFEKFSNVSTNLFYSNLPNIYASDFSNNLANKLEKPNIVPLENIIENSYIYSNIVSNKIICANYTNQYDCWNDNNCQWINNYNNSFQYCDITPKWLL